MDPKQLKKDKQCAKKFRASESQNALIYWKIFTSMFRFHNTFKVQTGNEQEALCGHSRNDLEMHCGPYLVSGFS